MEKTFPSLSLSGVILAIPYPCPKKSSIILGKSIGVEGTTELLSLKGVGRKIRNCNSTSFLGQVREEEGRMSEDEDG